MQWFLVFREWDSANNCWRVSKVINIHQLGDPLAEKVETYISHNKCIAVKAIDELAAYKRGLEEK